MSRLHTIKYRIWLFALLWLIGTISAHAQILNDTMAARADSLVLKNEISVFSTLQHGYQIAVAECELDENCAADVSRAEIEQLITTIDLRINSLSTRYNDSGEASLEEVLLGYVDVRDSYGRIIEKLDELPQFEQAAVEDTVDDFFSGASGGSNVSPEIQRLFEDADDELTDDDFE